MLINICVRACCGIDDMRQCHTAQVRTGNALFVGKFFIECVKLLSQGANGRHLRSEGGGEVGGGAEDECEEGSKRSTRRQELHNEA